MPRGLWSNNNRAGGADSGVHTETITATETLTVNSAHFQRFTASGGNVNVVLPDETKAGRLWFVISNKGASNNVVVKDDASNTIATLAPGFAGMFVCDGTSWYLGMWGPVTTTTTDYGAGGIAADVIAESTAAAGVTVDGTLLKDGGVTGGTSGVIVTGSSGSYKFGGIGTLAAAGTNAATAGVVAKQITYVTASDGTKGVVLPTAAAGLWFEIHNTVDTAPLYVYPNTSDAIGTRAADAVIIIPGGGNAKFIALDATTWILNRGGEGDGTLQFAEVALTNTNMVNLRATPITLVAAPGAGKLLEFVGGVMLFDYTAAYTESADNMAVKYTDGSGAAVSQAIEATGFVDATADTMTTIQPKIDAIVAASGSTNKALVLHQTGDGEYGGGNAGNVMRLKIAYRVWTVGF